MGMFWHTHRCTSCKTFKRACCSSEAAHACSSARALRHRGTARVRKNSSHLCRVCAAAAVQTHRQADEEREGGGGRRHGWGEDGSEMTRCEVISSAYGCRKPYIKCVLCVWNHSQRGLIRQKRLYRRLPFVTRPAVRQRRVIVIIRDDQTEPSSSKCCLPCAQPLVSILILVWKGQNTTTYFHKSTIYLLCAVCGSQWHQKEYKMLQSGHSEYFRGFFWADAGGIFFCINLLVLVNVASTVCEKYSNIQVYRVSSLSTVKVSCFSLPMHVDYVYQAPVP